MKERQEFWQSVLSILESIIKGQSELTFAPLGLVVIPAFVVGRLSVVGEEHRISETASSVAPFLSAGLAATIIGTLISWFVLAYFNGKTQRASERHVREVESRANANPKKPELAWEVGRVTLEKYLDRNVKQVRTIAILTYGVMAAGFCFILFGLGQSFNNPSNLPVSIVSAASGVLVSFIGGSFLLVYRSLLRQTREYVTVLERINGVGMAVAIIASIPDENADLKNTTSADLAKTLLSLYAPK